ncbi:MAG: T9SS type A sorting domain-containing protein [Bacteroidetes bacterium]|nr:T9SS type A sorting domain-containing protein [Bacteroidota bacterium]
MKKILLLIFTLSSFSFTQAQWQQTNGPIGGTIGALAINGNNIFAGTDEGGVFLSTNNGTNWSAVNTGLTNNLIYSLAISGSNIFAGTNGGIFFSSNNGANWTAVNNGLTNLIIKSLAISGNNIFAGTNGGGIFKSTNNGTSWTAMNNGLYPTNNIIYCLTISGSNIFAGTGNGVFLSTNNGASWTAVNTGLTNNLIYSLAISGSNIFAGTYGGGIFKSTNNGSSWTAMNTGITSLYVRSLAINGSNVFAGTQSDGVFLSANDGANWSAVNTGLTNNTVYCLAISGSNIFAGTWMDGVFLSNNNGASWTPVNNGLTNILIYSFAISGNNIFAGTDGKGIFLSINNGASWTAVNSGLTNLTIKSIAISGSNIFAGTDGGGVFLSTNNGASWTAVNTGLTNNQIYSLAIIGSNIFAGTYGGGVFISTNNGASWTAINTGLPNLNIITLGINGSDIYTQLGIVGYVYKSTNNGLSWTLANIGLPSYGVSCFVTSGSTIFAGISGGGVFKSTNNGTSWTAVNTGLTTLYVNNLAISGGNIFAGTYGGGVFKSTNSGASWTAVNTGFTSIFNISRLATNGSILFAGLMNSSVWKNASVLCNYPSISASNLLVSNLTDSSATLIWTRGNGSKVIILANADSAVNTNPIDGNSYTANSVFGNGNQIGMGNYAVYNGTGNTVNIKGLSAGTTYYYAIYEFDSTSNCYLSNALTGNLTTTCPPVSILLQPVPSQTSCSPSSNILFNVKASGGFPFTYQWQYFNGTTWNNVINGTPSGAIYANTNSDSITVSGITILSIYKYRCSISNCNGANTIMSDSACLIIINPPSPAASISGITAVCAGTNTVLYSTPTITGATSYIWSLPSGASGSSTSNTISVTYGISSVSGYITVKGSNTICSGIPSSLAITVNPLPLNAGNISGTSVVCQGVSSINYSIPLINNATSYFWTLPNGASGSSTSNSINVNYSIAAVSGNITVKGSNSCGDGVGSNKAITVNSLPATFNSITGSSSVYTGQQNVVYSVPADPNTVNYTWDIPSGATSVYNGNTLTVNYSSSAVSGYISVQGDNTCGYGQTTSKYITVNPVVPNCSAQFSLVADTTTLHHYYAYNNASGIPPLHFYWNWGDGSHDTIALPSHTYTTAGFYKICLSITDSVGCNATYCDSSFLQKTPNSIITINVVPQGWVGINNLIAGKVSIYPNPAKDNLIIELKESKVLQNNNVSIYNIQGQLLKQLTLKESKTEIDIHSFATGIYIVKVNNQKESFVSRFVKE